LISLFNATVCANVIYFLIKAIFLVVKIGNEWYFMEFLELFECFYGFMSERIAYICKRLHILPNGLK